MRSARRVWGRRESDARGEKVEHPLISVSRILYSLHRTYRTRILYAQKGHISTCTPDLMRKVIDILQRVPHYVNTQQQSTINIDNMTRSATAVMLKSAAVICDRTRDNQNKTLCILLLFTIPISFIYSREGWVISAGIAFRLFAKHTKSSSLKSSFPSPPI